MNPRGNLVRRVATGALAGAALLLGAGLALRQPGCGPTPAPPGEAAPDEAALRERHARIDEKGREGEVLLEAIYQFRAEFGVWPVSLRLLPAERHALLPHWSYSLTLDWSPVPELMLGYRNEDTGVELIFRL